MSRRNKFRAVRTKVGDVWCDSKGEAARYRDLLLMQQAGEIEQLALHPKYPIVINDQHVCLVVLDFAYYDNAARQWIFEDFKGVYTQESKLRHKLFEAYYGEKVTITRRGDAGRNNRRS